jgi:hypothetical protein
MKEINVLCVWKKGGQQDVTAALLKTVLQHYLRDYPGGPEQKGNG